MRRREALANAGSLLVGVSAGCLETLRREDAWRELVVDPPTGVYVPSHADGMITYASAGRRPPVLARSESTALVLGRHRRRAEPRRGAYGSDSKKF